MQFRLHFLRANVHVCQVYKLMSMGADIAFLMRNSANFIVIASDCVCKRHFVHAYRSFIHSFICPFIEERKNNLTGIPLKGVNFLSLKVLCVLME